MKIRLNKVQKELNLGLSTIVEYLQKKGFEIKEDPNAVVPEEGYEMLMQEFSADKKARIQSDNFIKERQNKEKPKAAPAPEVKQVEKPVAAPVEKPMETPKQEVKAKEEPVIKVMGRIDLDALNRKKAEPKKAEPKKVEKAEAAELTLIPEEKLEAGSSAAKAAAYIKSVMLGLGCTDVTVSAANVDGAIYLQLDGDKLGACIGRRGETLDAIQYLTRLVINRGSEEYKRVSINVGNYREKREGTLRALAQKNAAKVRKYGRNVVLEPMNPYERRIIHTTVQEIEGVTSHSVGSDGDRKVVITLEEGVKPTHGGGYNKGRGGYNKGGNRGGYRGGNRGGNRRYNDDAPAAPARAPRSDSAGASLYGKIEINK